LLHSASCCSDATNAHPTRRPHRPTAGKRPAAIKPRAKVAITLRLDPDRAARLQAIADAENRSLTNYVETALLRDLARREEAERVITMHVAPGASTSLSPEDGRATSRCPPAPDCSMRGKQHVSTSPGASCCDLMCWQGFP
jgi:hypothetical protein